MVSAPTRSRLQVDERRQQLLDLGLRLFRDRTYDEISIDEIAREAGVSKGLLYHYFPSKRAFYVAAIRHAADQLFLETDEGPFVWDGSPPIERLERVFGTFIDQIDRKALHYSFVLRGGIGADPEVADIVESTRARFLDRMLESLGADHSNAELRTVLRGHVGFVEAVFIWKHNAVFEYMRYLKDGWFER